jgi:glycosyltransferase involved in cell wall biosynthesis
MPTYNGANLLAETIDSILNQTFKDFEFIIINDCSPEDETDKIIAKYNDSRIRYIHNEKNLGISGSSNKGISLAQGRYIARQDHDDISLPTRLEEQYNYMESHPEIGICGTYFKSFGRKFLKEKGTIRPVESNEIKAALFNRCPILHPASMMRKELFDKHCLKYDESFKTANDLKLWIDASKITEFHNIPKVLFKQRKHSNRTSKIQKITAQNEVNRLFDIKFEKMSIKLSQEEREIFDNYILGHKSKNIGIDLLLKIEDILISLVKANQKSTYFPVNEFNKIIGKYWFKRCQYFMEKNKKSVGKYYSGSELSKYSDKICLREALIFRTLSFFLPKQKDVVN